MPFEIDLTTQLFGYETIEVNGEEVDIDIPNFEISLDGKDLFYPGMGSSMATLAEQALIFNFTKTILDDSVEIQSTHLFDLKDQGQLHQIKLSYNLMDNLDISLLLYQGLGNKNKYEFLQWDCELGDCVIFDMRTLHGTLSSIIPNKTLSRYTLRVAKEDAKISYIGDWTSYNYRKSMQEAGYKNGDPLGGKMFPTLFEAS